MSDGFDPLQRSQDLNEDIMRILKANPHATKEQLISVICSFTGAASKTVEKKIKDLVESNEAMVSGAVVLPGNLKTRTFFSHVDFIDTTKKVVSVAAIQEPPVNGNPQLSAPVKKSTGKARKKV